MAKKRGTPGSKDKGRGRYQRQDGLRHIRRAAGTKRRRQGDLTRLDDLALDELSTEQRFGHSGEHLLARFNRQARDTHTDQGERGEVCGFDGASILVRDETGEHPCRLRQVLKKMLPGVSNPVVVGDSVTWQQDSADQEQGIITGLLPRRNQLARVDSHNKALWQVFAANIDHLVMVASTTMPDLKPGLIDRYLIIAAMNDIPACLVITKSDLAPDLGYGALYQALGIPVFYLQAHLAANSNDDRAALQQHLAGASCVLAGQSGVGKSSTLNTLHPSCQAKVGAVSDVQRKGRHTTIASRSHALPDGGRLIDTPGVRECAIGGIEPLSLALLFPEFAARHQQCRFHNCLHTHEPDCAVLAAVEAGDIHPSRYLSYRSMLDEDLA